MLRRHGNHHNRAFTLVEVLIAVMLMVLMGVTTAGVVVVSGRMSAGNARQARAIAFAEEMLEQIMAARFDTVAHGQTLPNGRVMPADSALQAFVGSGDLGRNPQWSIEITNPDEFHRLIDLDIQWGDPVTGRLITRNFRCYRYDDEIITYPHRHPTAG